MIFLSLLFSLSLIPLGAYIYIKKFTVRQAHTNTPAQDRRYTEEEVKVFLKKGRSEGTET